MANPELELHRLIRPIDGPIGDREDLWSALYCWSYQSWYQTLREAQIGEAAAVGAGNDQPLIIRAVDSCALEIDLAVGIGELGEVERVDLDNDCLPTCSCLPAEELDVRFRDRLPVTASAT